MEGDITVTAAPATQVSFKDCVQFAKCITEIDGTTIDDSKDLNFVMSMHNLIEYSSNYSKTAGSLWFYSKDEATNFNNNLENTDNFKSFEYKTKLLGNTITQPVPSEPNGILKNATIAVSLKYLSNFRRSLEMPFINCKIEPKLEWAKYSVLYAAGNDDTNADPNNIISTIKDTRQNYVYLSSLYQQKINKNYQKLMQI